MNIECNVWEDDHALSDLADCDATGQALLSLSEEVDRSDDADGLVDPLWRLLWSLRRVMWRDMIPEGRAGVRFVHRHEAGDGVGPITYIGLAGSLGASPSQWDNDSSLLVFSGSEFADSDTMHMEFASDPGLFGWLEFSQQYVSYADNNDSDLYEHSFDAESVLAVDASLAPPVWSLMESSAQLRILSSIFQAHQREMDEFEELWVDGSDVLALIAAHPTTSTEVLEAGAVSGGRCFALGLAQR